MKDYSLAAHFHVGDAVRLECKQTDRGLVLSGLHRVGGGQPKPPVPAPGGDNGNGGSGTPQPPANRIAGKVAATTDTTLTVADGGRSLTCTAVGDMNPARVFHVGDPVILECKQTDAGALVIASVHKVTPTPVPPTEQPPPNTNPAPAPPAGGDHK